MTVTIYHNPKCGTSRNTLALLQDRGVDPVVVEYLKVPPAREELASLAAGVDGGVRALLRERGTPYHDLGLDDPKWSDDDLIGFIVEHPILLNRPVVSSPKGVIIARPAEKALDLI